MVRRWVASVVVFGATLVAGQAIAGDVVNGVTCPDTARRNQSVNAIVLFSNSKTTSDVIVTRGALGLHLGNVTLVGPLAFQVNPQNALTVPRGIPVPPPPGCFGCPGTVNPGSASLTVPVRIPPQARPGTFISVGLGFFGQQSDDPVGSPRRELGAQGCVIEITP